MIPELILILICAGLIVAGWNMRTGYDAWMLRRRRQQRAESIFTVPFRSDYRDEFNELRNSLPVDDNELARAKPIHRPL